MNKTEIKAYRMTIDDLKKRKLNKSGLVDADRNERMWNAIQKSQIVARRWVKDFEKYEYNRKAKEGEEPDDGA